jgi:hypothetical protein
MTVSKPATPWPVGRDVRPAGEVQAIQVSVGVMLKSVAGGSVDACKLDGTPMSLPVVFQGRNQSQSNRVTQALRPTLHQTDKGSSCARW